MFAHSLAKLLLMLAACIALATTQAYSAKDAAQYRADLYYNLAEGNYSMGDIPAAKRVIEQVLRIQPDHTEAQQLQKRISEEDIKSIQAPSAPSTPPQESPENQTPAPNLSALSTLGKTIEADPTMQDLANYLRGRAALAKGRVGTARQYFEKALQQLPAPEDPLRPHILFHHALCLEKLNRKDRAEAGLMTALDAGYLPESQDDALQAAHILLRIDKPARALPFLEAIVLNHPKPKADAWDMLGRAHQATNQYKRAISAYNQSIEIAPEKITARALRAGLFRQLGQFELAEADYQKALQNDPENTPLHFALGLLQIRIRSLDLAYESLLKASKSEATPPFCHLFLALLAHANSDLPQAQNHLTQYFERTSKDAVEEAAYYLEYSLAAANRDSEQALMTLRQRADRPEATAALGAYLAYCTGQKTRKELLDLAGTADHAKQAKQQICEAAYWMAQHEWSAGQIEPCRELLQITLRNGSPEQIEPHLANWQWNRISP